MHGCSPFLLLYFFFAAAAATSTASLKIISHDGFSPWEKQFVSSVYFYLQKSRSAFAKIKDMIKVSLETAPLLSLHKFDTENIRYEKLVVLF